MELRTDSQKQGAAMIAGALSWAIPGSGHFFLGHRALGVVFFIAISLPFWTGMALGGILDSASMRTNQWLTLSAFGVGGYAAPCVIVSNAIERQVFKEVGVTNPATLERDQNMQRSLLNARAKYMSFYPGSDVAQIYIAAAGLMNLLVILDAVSRALYGGLPTFHGHLVAQSEGATP